MSAETQPDPILPNYNPSSWDVPTLSPEERAILDTEYITFPIAQNQNITFPVSPTAPTLDDGTNTTQVATTGFVQNAITAFKAASNIWSGIQTFSAGITTATISAISGTFTLTGATTVSNATFSGTTTLSNSFTPAYSYPIGTDKIGQIIEGTFTTTTTIVVDTPMTNWTISSLPAGTWLMIAGVARTNGVGYSLIAITTTDNSFSGSLSQDFTNTAGLGNVQTIAYVVQVPNNTTPYYIVAQTDIGGSWLNSLFSGIYTLSFRAIRIA
jgi:hypothetical protein